MKMNAKRLLSWVLITVLALCCWCAQADTISEFRLLSTETFLSYHMSNGETAATYVGQGDGRYQMFNAEGEAISAEYKEMIDNKSVYRVVSGTGMGLVDAVTGQELVPCEYEYAEPFSFLDGWYAAFRLEKATDDDYDFTDIVNKDFHMKIITTDIWHGNELVATLPREKFHGDTAAVHQKGAYIWLRAKKDSWTYTIYDSAFNELKKTDETSEYETNFSTGKVVHIPTGQEAFTEGCTLTPEDVEIPYYVNRKSEKGIVVQDLQGNEILVLEKDKYDWVSDIRSCKNYINVEKDGLYGLIDLNGNEVIPCICSTSISTGKDCFASGYHCAEVDGKPVIFNTSGEKVMEIGADQDTENEAEPEEIRYNTYLSGLITVIGEYGNYQIISSETGFFPETYIEYNINGNTIRVKNLEEKSFLLDTRGNVIADMAGWTYFELSGDGTLVLAKDEETYRPHVAVITRGE